MMKPLSTKLTRQSAVLHKFVPNALAGGVELFTPSVTVPGVFPRNCKVVTPPVKVRGLPPTHKAEGLSSTVTGSLYSWLQVAFRQARNVTSSGLQVRLLLAWLKRK